MQWVIVSLIPPPMMAENARVASQQTKRKITREREIHSIIIHPLLLRIPLLGLFLGTLRLSSAVLQMALSGLGQLGVRHAVGLDVLLTVGGELGLPVALALLLLLERVLLVALEVLGVGVGCWWAGLVLCMGRGVCGREGDILLDDSLSFRLAVEAMVLRAEAATRV